MVCPLPWQLFYASNCLFKFVVVETDKNMNDPWKRLGDGTAVCVTQSGEKLSNEFCNSALFLFHFYCDALQMVMFKCDSISIIECIQLTNGSCKH
jgi:hypothetical protein